MTLIKILAAAAIGLCLVSTAVSAQTSAPDAASVHAQMSAAAKAADEGNGAEALRLFRPLAEAGNPLAQYVMGRMYWEGTLVPRDAAVALGWFQKAAQNGNRDAQRMLGNLYANGVGVTRDYDAAIGWFRKAADQGDAGAAVALGMMSERGLGGPQDYAAAMSWYQKAAAQTIPSPSAASVTCITWGTASQRTMPSPWNGTTRPPIAANPRRNACLAPPTKRARTSRATETRPSPGTRRRRTRAIARPRSTWG